MPRTLLRVIARFGLVSSQCHDLALRQNDGLHVALLLVGVGRPEEVAQDVETAMGKTEQ